MKPLLAAASFLFACAAIAGATDQYAPSVLSAPAILAKARVARGTLLPGTYVIVDRIRVGGIERIRTTRLDHANSIAVTQGGGFTSAAGVFNGQSWFQDENGLVLLRSNFRAFEDPNNRALAHPEDPANHVTVLGISNTQPAEYVVHVNPPGGSEQYRYYDAKTFLLDRFVTLDADLHRHVTEFSDYRPVFESVRPFRIHSSDGRPQNDTVTDTLSFSQTTPGDAVVAVPASRPLFTIASPTVIPARFTSKGIVVRAMVGERGLDLLLDSGASALFIDPGVAHELGLPRYGRISQTIGGDIDISKTRVPELHIGPLALHDVAFNEAPLSQYVDGARVVGILGYDFIASAILGIDFKKSSITLYPTSFDVQDLGTVALPIQLDDGIPRIQASFENVPGFFALDTGAMATLAYKTYVQKLNRAFPIEDEASLTVVGGSVPAELRQLTDLDFGGVRYRDAPVFVPKSSTFNLSDYDGILGRDVLSNYQVYLDYAHREVYLKPTI